MVVRYLLVLLAVVAGCKSGELPCPDVKKIKLRKTSYYRIQPPSDDPATTSAYNYELLRAERKGLKKAEFIEEWDCPKPGQQSNKKIVKANKRKMERQLREDLKKKKEMKQLDPSLIPGASAFHSTTP